MPYIAKPVGPVRLTSHSSRRARLWAGGTFFRSLDRGQLANKIEISCVEKNDKSEAVLVVHNTVLKPSEQIALTGLSLSVDLFELSLKWDEEIHLEKIGDAIEARKYGIRWQIAFQESLGKVTLGRLFTLPGIASFKVSTGDWPAGAKIVLKPRMRRYHLVVSSSTDASTGVATTGWEIESLRGALNGSDPWITMPTRQTDGLDDKADDPVLIAFGPEAMTGGDGLPVSPAGLNTGPARTLVHLNYSESDDGRMIALNQVFEWIGDSSTSGSWVKYA